MFVGAHPFGRKSVDTGDAADGIKILNLLKSIFETFNETEGG